MNQEYTRGLSIDEHIIIRNYILRQKKEIDIDELAKSKKHIKGIVERQFSLDNNMLVRKMAARYLGIESESLPGVASNLLASSQPQNRLTQGDTKKE